MKYPNEIIQKRKMLLADLKARAKAKGITQEDIATGAGLRSNNCNRMLQGRYSPYIDTVIAMAGAAGYELVLIEKPLSNGQAH